MNALELDSKLLKYNAEKRYKKRFKRWKRIFSRYLILDDTTLSKSGKRIEKIG